MVGNERRRRRPATSCNVCRRRKLKCNREAPCSNCLRSRKREACVYEDEQPRARRPSSQGQAGHGSASATSTSEGLGILPPNPPSSLIGSIRQVEEDLGKLSPTATRTHSSTYANASTPASDIETATTQLGGTFHIHHQPVGTVFDKYEPSRLPNVSQVQQPTSCSGDGQRRLLGGVPGIARNISHKTRLFGQSHWFNTIAPLVGDMIQLTEPFLSNGSSQAAPKLQKCKSLARLIKTRRAPPWPCPPTPDLPPKDLADRLVENYLQTIESLYRVMHVPSFRRDYEAIWTSHPPANNTNPDENQGHKATSSSTKTAGAAFLVQLKLVLALGALTHDDTFSLRTSAVRWTYEAQTYLAEPVFKSRLTIQALQTRVLLLLARELIDVGEDSVWVEVGSVARTAVFMGLHRDPDYLPRTSSSSSSSSSLQAEMRRRLWNTILELSLQASVYLGGPPLLSGEDFDSGTPGNFDDESLVGGVDGQGATQPEGEDVFTGMTIPRALRATWNVRLRVVKFLNDVQRHGGGSYADTLEMDAQIRTAFKVMRQTLQRCHPNNTTPAAAVSATRGFAAQAVEFLAQRYTSALHAPYLGASFHETAYAFSRSVLLDTTLKMWRAAYPTSAIAGGQAPSSSSPSTTGLFSRIVLCSSGFFRTAAAQANFVFPAELRAQLQEDGYEGALLRRDLLAAVEEGKAWSLRCVEAGETNVKGHMTPCLLAAHMEGLRRGLGGDEVALGRFLVTEAEEALDRALVVLEETAARTRSEGVLEDVEENGQLGGETLDAGFLGMAADDWDFTMPDAMLTSDDQGALVWAFGDESMQKVSLW